MVGVDENELDPGLSREVAAFGARDMDICMQCAACSASCPLSSGITPFPRKIYRFLQLGLRDKLLAACEPWLCYYCGECNADCPRGAEPAETMMAVRRWLTAQYDRTGLARRLYLSKTWEIGALVVVALGVMLLFLLGHGPVITGRVSVNSFAPVLWVEIGDLAMAAVLSAFLLSNAWRMARLVMGDTQAPLALYVSQARTFALNFLTQKRWRSCGEDRRRWRMHFILVTGYLTMMTLIIGCIRWFQVDDDSWHFTSIFGYYATAVLLFVTVDMFRSRLKKEASIHRYSEFSDWLFLILLFSTTLTGILMHAVRLAGWPMGTYVLYVIHLAIAVPMLVVEVPFGKWSHLFYRPLAVFLAAVKEKALQASRTAAEDIIDKAGEAFMSCLQCGVCTSGCPWNLVAAGRLSLYNPRRILRELSLNAGSRRSVDQAAWSCLTCNTCGLSCPRGIDIIEVIEAVRTLNLNDGKVPEAFKTPLASLRAEGNPWGGKRDQRMKWVEDRGIPGFDAGLEYCLFTCCTTAYDPDGRKAGQALLRLLSESGITFGTLGPEESCCGDPAHILGDAGQFSQVAGKNTERFLQAGVSKILTTSPHCLNTFRRHYQGLKGRVTVEHYTVLLERLVSEGCLTPVREIDRVVTFHDPCYLGRHNGIYQAPRRILQRIPGFHLVEMANHGEGSLCCGGGGGGAWYRPPTEGRLSDLRVRQALGSGAQIIATACPFCLRMLNETIRTLGVGERLVVRDVAQLLLQAVTVPDGTVQDATIRDARGTGGADMTTEQEAYHA